MWEYNNSTELYHHGVLGMKWGVRRYQNKDGTYTAAGQKRYAQEQSANAKRKKDKRVSEDAVKDPNYWVNEDYKNAKNVADSSAQMTRNLQNLNRDTTRGSSRNRKQMDLSSMSDKELRDAINRAQLERQYNDIYNPATVNRGREVVNNTLQVAGDVLTIGSTALSIALAIRSLSGKGA